MTSFAKDESFLSFRGCCCLGLRKNYDKRLKPVRILLPSHAGLVLHSASHMKYDCILEIQGVAQSVTPL